MATTIASSRIWNGLKVDEVTYTETGKIELNSTGGSLLASSSNSDWEIEDTELFTRLYNNRARYSAQLTTTEFERTFYNEGRPLFNIDRAAVLNDNTNYSNLTAAENNRTQFFKNGIPGLQNPVTGQVVNNDGTFTDGNPFGLPPQSLNNGVPSEFGTTSLPNDLLTVGSVSNTDSLDETANRARGTRSGNSVQSLRYPLNESPEFPGDYLLIEGREYSARSANLGSISGSNPTGGLVDGGGKSSIEKRMGDVTGRVILPLQAGLSETNKIGWSGDKINFMQSAFADVAMSMIQQAGNNPIAIGDIAQAGVNQLRAKTGQALDDYNTDNFIRSYFAGQAVGVDIVRRATGAVANPNLELFFEKPELRDFSFVFKLSPRDRPEALRIKEIIKFLKSQIHPKKSNKGLFLYTPNIFKLAYMYGGQGTEHPFLFKFKPCAMVQFDVNYGEPNHYMTYQDGSLPTYQLTMAFKELEPIYAEDYEENSRGMGY